MSITRNYKKIREEIPSNVSIIVAAKTREPDEIKEVILAGAKDIGENYVQEAEEKISNIKNQISKLNVKWHMIGYLQKNKINKALSVFDMIQTIDSFEKAEDINKRAERINKKIPVLIEINIGSEFSKAGIKPKENEPFEEYMEKLAQDISKLKYIRLEGLMTMGPRTGNPEDLRPYFKRTRNIFEKIKALNIENVEMKYLSMGMTNSYKIAIEEGSNMVRIGTAIFRGRNEI